jgi:hypothetical protein
VLNRAVGSEVQQGRQLFLRGFGQGWNARRVDGH